MISNDIQSYPYPHPYPNTYPIMISNDIRPEFSICCQGFKIHYIHVHCKLTDPAAGPALKITKVDQNPDLARLPLAVRRPIQVPCGRGPSTWFIFHSMDLLISVSEHWKGPTGVQAPDDLFFYSVDLLLSIFEQESGQQGKKRQFQMVSSSRSWKGQASGWYNLAWFP